MIINRASKGRLYLNKTQQNKIDHTLNCCRFIYNEMLARNIKMYKRRGEHLSYMQMQYLLKPMKAYRPWLKDADSQALAHACRQLDTAYQKFFKHEARFPKFHKKNARQAYTTTNPAYIEISPNKVRIPTLGWLKVRGMRPVPDGAKICRATITRETDGRYYVSILYKYETSIVPHSVREDNALGLDYSSASLYVDSNGHSPDYEHKFSKNQAKLAKEQRILIRRIGSRKGERKSSNWHKQYRKVCRIQSKTAHQRFDSLHKISKDLADIYDLIGVEDINMRALSNTGFGNGKATLDNGYGMFRTMLEYKLSDRGKQLLRIDRFYPSSQICSSCGYQNPQLKDLSIRKWKCPECGVEHDRDVNAAINIKTEALRMIALSQVS